MAIQTEIKRWIAASAADLDLRILELGWPKTWARRFTAIQATASIGGRDFIGQGFDVDQDIAVIKATVEAIERSVKDVHGLRNSSGLAGHGTSEQASINASNELVERDAFFCHYLTKIPFSAFDPTLLLANGALDWPHISRLAREARIELVIARMTVPEGLNGIVCAAFGHHAQRPFGTILGLGCSNNVVDAIQKATWECLANITAHIEGALEKPISVEEFLRLDKPGVLEHMRLGLSSESAIVMRSLLGTGDPHEVTVNSLSIEIKTLPPPKILESCPLILMLAESVDAQTAFFGHLHPNVLNIDRLQKFANKPLMIHDIQSHPHFLG
jgi:YcaO cyclodehydratase, ATP-ad Mg2+-binding